jgi:hypothetical protein
LTEVEPGTVGIGEHHVRRAQRRVYYRAVEPIVAGSDGGYGGFGTGAGGDASDSGQRNGKSGGG